MRAIGRTMRRFVRDERGLETVEYAIIAALITLAAIATITSVGFLVNQKFVELEGHLDTTPTP